MSNDYKGYVPERIVCSGCATVVEEKPWNPHPNFKGVALRHLMTSKETGGMFSAHVVRVDPGCCLESHVHEGQWELHEVVRGSATAQVDGVALDYFPGMSSVIPKGVRHDVTAGNEGVLLLAKFIPALV